MYRIWWIEDGKTKDIYVESWIERDAIIEDLKVRGVEAEYKYVMV